MQLRTHLHQDAEETTARAETRTLEQTEYVVTMVVVSSADVRGTERRAASRREETVKRICLTRAKLEANQRAQEQVLALLDKLKDKLCRSGGDI